MALALNKPKLSEKELELNPRQCPFSNATELAAQSVWPVDRIKDYAVKTGSGVTPTGGSAAYLDAGVPLLRSQNVHFDGLRLDAAAYIADPGIRATVKAHREDHIYLEGPYRGQVNGNIQTALPRFRARRWFQRGQAARPARLQWGFLYHLFEKTGSFGAGILVQGEAEDRALPKR
jgi:hypothetical protein